MNDDSMHTRSDQLSSPADVLEFTEFTVTAEQAAELFKAAGFPRSPDHISRWCRQGELRATKQQLKNRLTRYLIDRRSIDEKIARLQQEQERHHRPSVFEAAANTTLTSRHDDDTSDVGRVPPRHHDGIQGIGMSAPVGWYEARDEIAELRGELRATKEHARRDAARIEKLEHENGGLRVALGKFQGKAEELERQVRLLTAPKQESSEAKLPVDTMATQSWSSWWRRLFR